MATTKGFTLSVEEKWERADERNCRLAAKVLYYPYENNIYDERSCFGCHKMCPRWHFVDNYDQFYADCRACRKKKRDAWWLENSRECSSCHKRHGLRVFEGKDTCKECQLAASLRRLDALLEASEEAKVARALIVKWYKEKYASVARCIKCRRRRSPWTSFDCRSCRVFYDVDSDDD